MDDTGSESEDTGPDPGVTPESGERGDGRLGGGGGRFPDCEGAEAEPKARGSKKPSAVNSVEELRSMLQQALEHEDYERASKLRDEIKRRVQQLLDRR